MDLEKAYRILGLSKEATIDEIKKKYRFLAKKWHPDLVNPSQKAEAEKLFREIAEAYRLLIEHKRLEKIIKDRKETFTYGKTPPRQAKETSPNISKTKLACIILGIVVAAIVIVNLQPKEQPSVVIIEREKAPIISISSESKEQNSHKKEDKNFSILQSPYKDFFSLGSKEKDVIRVQGIPEKRFGRVWHYGLSRVFFNQEGEVIGYDNFDGQLRVQLIPRVVPYKMPKFFTLGSTQDEVILVQGTPSRIVKNTWHYGIDRIFFDSGSQKVIGYDNPTGSLRVRIISKNERAVKEYFTEGDSQEEVALVQGTPDRVENDKWYYGGFYVIFKDKRVVGVGPVYSETSLKFMPKRN